MMASIMHSYVMNMDVVNAYAMSTYGRSVFEWRCDRVDVLTTPHPGHRRQTISIKTQQRR
jgi:hypothetical protein